MRYNHPQPKVGNWIASWAVTYAYKAHYNSGVVNAAEVSLNQVANLIVAILLKLLFNFGRDAALTDVQVKVLSCAMIALGMLIACYE